MTDDRKCPFPVADYTAATFGHEAARPHSVVTVAVFDSARRAVHAALDISMFVRTRKPGGQIFYLGSLPRFGQTDETLVGASLKGGELLVHLRFNQTPEDYTVGGTRLDNGHLHLIEVIIASDAGRQAYRGRIRSSSNYRPLAQVVRNSTLVQVKLNGTEYFRKSISAAKQLDAQVRCVLSRIVRCALCLLLLTGVLCTARCCTWAALRRCLLPATSQWAPRLQRCLPRRRPRTATLTTPTTSRASFRMYRFERHE